MSIYGYPCRYVKTESCTQQYYILSYNVVTSVHMLNSCTLTDFFLNWSSASCSLQVDKKLWRCLHWRRSFYTNKCKQSQVRVRQHPIHYEPLLPPSLECTCRELCWLPAHPAAGSIQYCQGTHSWLCTHDADENPNYRAPWRGWSFHHLYGTRSSSADHCTCTTWPGQRLQEVAEHVHQTLLMYVCVLTDANGPLATRAVVVLRVKTLLCDKFG